MAEEVLTNFDVMGTTDVRVGHLEDPQLCNSRDGQINSETQDVISDGIKSAKLICDEVEQQGLSEHVNKLSVNGTSAAPDSSKGKSNTAIGGTTVQTAATLSWANRVKATNNPSTAPMQPFVTTSITNSVANSSVRDSVTEDDTEFDSALFAGMCDARERVALLRLETVLVDFMNCDATWLEVGGPYNSTVFSHNNKVVVRPPNGSTSSANGLPEPVLGQRQTSFQKCILHKCADRFRIIRQPGTMMLGSLRLIKLTNSKIPTRLLKDLDPSEYLNNANVYDSRQFYNTNHNYEPRQQYNTLVAGGNSNKVNITTEQQNQVATPSLPRSIGGTSIAESREVTAPTGSNTGVTSVTTVKPKKMQIMKRSDKPKPTTDASQEKKFIRKHSSELSEKEKAYAEARARIFNEESSASSLVDSDNKNMTLPSVGTNTELESTSSSDTRALAVVSEALDTESTEATERRPCSPSQCKDDAVTTVVGQMGENIQQSSSNGSSTNLPQLENKAVYRNRAEEAADPDFRRHRNNPAIVSAPMFGISPSVVPAAPLHSQPVAAAAIPPFSTSVNWIQPTAAAYPVAPQQHHLQSSIMQQPQHAHPYHVQATGRQQVPTQYQQYPSQQYVYSQQPYSMQVNMYDVGMNPSPQTGSVATGKYQHQRHQNTYKEYNGGRFYNNSGNQSGNYQTGGTTAKQRNSVALKAAAPAFYPSRNAQSTRIEGNSSDVNLSTQNDEQS